MRIHLFILISLFYSTMSFGQQTEIIQSICKTVATINSDTIYSIKKLDNDYFVEVKDEAADGGQELTGFYKQGKIKKMIYSVGLSYGMTTYTFYFLNDQIIFVLEKQDKFALVKDSIGSATGINYTKPEFAFEGHYYFNKSKLFKSKKNGKELLVDEREGSKENKLLAQSKVLFQELKNAK